jgi:rod shape-determining protein MreC
MRHRLDRRARRQLISFAGLLAVSVLLIGIGGTGLGRRIQNVFNFAMNPIVSVMNDAADSAGSAWTALGELNRLREENETLRLENEALRQELARMPSVSRLTDDWTRITQAQQSIPFQSTRARVLMRDLSDVRPRIFVLDKGSRDGMREGLVVVGEGFSLVGRVESVEDRVCTVSLLTDLTSVVIGREESSGAIGTVRGQPGGLLSMSFPPESPKVESGQPVVTAGESIAGSDIRSPYPPGLLIGSLSAVSKDATASAIVTPSANLGSMTFALIITDYEGGIPVSSPSPSPSPSRSPSASPSQP